MQGTKLNQPFPENAKNEKHVSISAKIVLLSRVDYIYLQLERMYRRELSILEIKLNIYRSIYLVCLLIFSLISRSSKLGSSAPNLLLCKKLCSVLSSSTFAFWKRPLRILSTVVLLFKVKGATIKLALLSTDRDCSGICISDRDCQYSLQTRFWSIA